MKAMQWCLALLLVAPTLAAAGQEELNKDVVRAMTEALNQREFDRLDELIAADVVRHSSATPGVVVENLEQFKAFLHQDLATCPDATQEINLLLADGDYVVGHVTYRGTQTGPMGPFPATGKPVEIPFIGILRLEKGKVAEIWVEWDNLNALTQLGHFPPPGAPEKPWK